MTAQLTKIKDTPGVQAVFNAGFGQGPAIVTRNYRQLAIGAPLYQSTASPRRSSSISPATAAEGVRLPAAALLVADTPRRRRSAEGGRRRPTSATTRRRYKASLDLRRPRL